MARGAVKPQSDLTLRHELPYYQQLPKDFDVFEGCPQHVIMASVGGYDMLFWVSAYILRGSTPDGFVTGKQGDAALCTMQVMAPQAKRGVMQDTDYICQGWSQSEHHKMSDLKVARTKEGAVWRIRDTTLLCRPPFWKVTGTDGVLAYDLSITGTAPTSWYVGDYERVAQRRVAVFDQFTSCVGSLTVKGKTYKINGYGGHEHPVVAVPMGQRFRGEAARGEKHAWIVGGGRGKQIFYWIAGEAARGYGRMLIDGKHIVCDGGSTYEELEWWHDPRSLVTIPCKWRLSMRSSDGTLEARLAASGRANRIWCLGNSYVLDVWILTTLNGNFRHRDGRVTPVEDVLCAVEWLKPIWP